MGEQQSEMERLKPGSAEARYQGCACDPDQQGPRYEVEKACPVHGLGELAALMGRS